MLNHSFLFFPLKSFTAPNTKPTPIETGKAAVPNTPKPRAPKDCKPANIDPAETTPIADCAAAAIEPATTPACVKPRAGIIAEVAALTAITPPVAPKNDFVAETNLFS